MKAEALKRSGFGAISIAFLTAASIHAAPVYKATIEPQFGRPWTRGEVLLTDSLRGHYPPPPRRLILTTEPAISQLPTIRWSASRGIKLTVEPQMGFGSSSPSVVEVDRNNFIGPFWISAELGSPVDASAHIAGFAYAQVAIGCAEGLAGGMSLDSHGIPHPSIDPKYADIYMTGPRLAALSLWDQCPAAFHDHSSHYTIHIPGGASTLRRRMPPVSNQ